MKKVLFFFCLTLTSTSFAWTDLARGYVKDYRGYEFFAGLDRENKNVIFGRDLFSTQQWDVLTSCTADHLQFMTVVKSSKHPTNSNFNSEAQVGPSEIVSIEEVVCVRNRTFFPQWQSVFGQDHQ